MTHFKLVWAVLGTASLCAAQTIAISGIVKDRAGAPVEAAEVRLEISGESTTTDADGNFTLGEDPSEFVNPAFRSNPTGWSAQLMAGRVGVWVEKHSIVAIAVFDLNGRQLFCQKQVMETGFHTVDLPSTLTGVYLCQVTSGNNRSVIKNGLIDGVVSGSVMQSSGISPKVLARKAAQKEEFNDVILVNKTDFLNYSQEIGIAETSGVSIELIPSEGVVADADGNEYQTVKIGTQIWTVENLRTTTYNDDTPITFDSTASWMAAPTEKFCYYNNITNADTIKKFGALYNWHAVNTGKLAPQGWHVPTSAEWDTLQNYLIGEGYNWDNSTTENKIAKSMASKTGWAAKSTPGAPGNDMASNNRSGFNAVPAGYRDLSGSFNFAGTYSNWWTSNDGAGAAPYRNILADNVVLGGSSYHKSSGYSVRLIKE